MSKQHKAINKKQTAKAISKNQSAKAISKKQLPNKRPKGPHNMYLSTMCYLFDGSVRVAIFVY